MPTPDFLQLLRRRWSSIVLVTLLGTVVSIAVTFATPPSYSASTELFISVQSPGSMSAGDIGQGTNAAQLKVKSYSKVATSSEVLAPVAAKLKLGSVDRLAGRITVTSPPGSQILVLTASDPDRARAAVVANAVSASFSELVVSRLEKPAGGQPAVVRIETIQPATAPTSASSPKLVPNVALGVIVGLLAGIGIAALRNTLDTKVRSDVDVRVAADLALAGSIAYDRAAAERPLVVHLDPQSPRSEAFRALRTNLQFLQAGRNARRFVVTSAMPSEGKTTTVANLAITLADGGLRTLVVDADLRRPRLAEVMGIDGTVGLTDVLIGRAELDDVVQPWGEAGLDVLPAGQIPPNPSELVGSAPMKAFLTAAGHIYDVVILDSPPVLPVTDAAILSTLVDGVLLVAAAGRSRRQQLSRAAALLRTIDATILGAILTMVSERKGPGAAGQYYTAYTGAEALPESQRGGRPHGRRRRE